MKHGEFCGPRRLHHLANLLETLNPLCSFIYKMRTEQGERGLLSPEEVEFRTKTMSPSEPGAMRLNARSDR